MTDRQEPIAPPGSANAGPTAATGTSTTAALAAAALSCAISVPIAAVGYFVIDIFFRSKLLGRDSGDTTTRMGGEGAIGDFLVALADGFIAAGLATMLALWLLPRSHRRLTFTVSAAGYIALAVALWLYASRGGTASPFVAGFWTATVLAGALAGSYVGTVLDLSEEARPTPPPAA